MVTCFVEANPTYKPATKEIVTIGNSYPALVTTQTDHEYEAGQTVRLYIGQACGMPQANNLTGEIRTIVGVNSFLIDIDTTFFDVFVRPAAPTPSDNICSYVVPVGEKASMLTSAIHNVL